MTEEKRNRIVAAITVSTLLFITILAAVVIYQLVILTSLKKQEQKIRQETQHYLEMTQQKEDELANLQSQWYLQQKAFEAGYHY